MEVDKSSAENAAAQRIAQKRQQQEIEEQKVALETARAQRERAKAVEAEKEKTDRALVEISKNAANQMDTARKLNTERVHALSENQQKSYDALSKKTAEELQRLDGTAASWQLVLAPKDEKVRKLVTWIRISGSGKLIRRVETEESDGDHSDMSIDETVQ